MDQGDDGSQRRDRPRGGDHANKKAAPEDDASADARARAAGGDLQGDPRFRHGDVQSGQEADSGPGGNTGGARDPSTGSGRDRTRRGGVMGRILDIVLGPTDRKGGKKRPHPYAHERSTEAETRLDAGQVTLFWLGLATVLVVAGWILQARYGYAPSGFIQHPLWEQWTLVPLFAGLALLGFGFVRESWAKRLTLVGWLLFAFYWALTAKDLFIKEDQDYVNFAFALVGVYFFTYLAYHQWLSLMRGVQNHAVHFLNVTAFIAAGTYFVIAKITFLRVWLINVVGEHTKWMLDLFGQGDKAGIVFVVDKQDSQGPVTFFYPDKYCESGRDDEVGDWCAENASGSTLTTPEPSGWFDQLLFYTPESDLTIVPVSIILACTAIQSIMLFVGLFAGTEAHWKRKLYASLVVGGIIYILNLVRNTGIIWFYGQGHASFWVMHNAIGKGGSLIAMVAIAFGVFRFFPEFFKSLTAVLDLPDRDGPIERTLKIGRRRPELPVGASKQG